MYQLQSQEIQDIKYVLRVLILYIPLPLFWSLFDQQGSRWTLQAVRMNGIMVSTVANTKTEDKSFFELKTTCYAFAGRRCDFA